MDKQLNRRNLIRMSATLPGVGALGARPSGGVAAFSPTPVQADSDMPSLDVLRIRHPNTLAFAAPFLLFKSGGELSAYADSIDVDVWPTPDVLRSMLVNDQSEVTAVPTYVGANLANRGIDVRMAAVVVWGLLSVVGPEGTEADWESLRGQTIMIPFPNDMPDLVFRYLAMNNGLVPGEDFQIEYFAQPPEIVSRLVSGNGSWAVMREHTTTLALSKAKQDGVELKRVLDLQEEWASVTGSEPRIPQAGIVVPGWIADERPELLGAILNEMDRAVEVVNASDPETVTILSEESDVPEPVVEDVIPRLNLDVVPAADAREELERFYTELLSFSEDILGGTLPDSSFYLKDPR